MVKLNDWERVAWFPGRRTLQFALLQPVLQVQLQMVAGVPTTQVAWLEHAAAMEHAEEGRGVGPLLVPEPPPVPPLPPLPPLEPEPPVPGVGVGVEPMATRVRRTVPSVK